MRTSPARISGTEKRLFADLRELVLSAKRRVAATVNSEIVLLYWSIGMRIKTDILKNRRAAYGEELVLRVATFLSDEFGNGWGFQTVRHCVRAAYTFRKKEIVYALRTQLTWTHLRSLMAIDDKLKRQFYLEMCAHEHWSTREEESPMGLILCSAGNTEHIEYLMLDETAKDIRVAQYFAGLPSKALLKRKLQRAIAIAQSQVSERD